MLSVEVAQFYGVKDGPPCADFVAFINGMLGFAEANRRECWDQFGLGLINVQAKLKALQTSHSELEAQSKFHEQNYKDVKARYEESVALNLRLNQALGAQRQSAAKTSPPPAAAEAPKVQLELATPNAGVKDAPRAKRAFPEATVPDSDDDQGPPAKRDKSETIIQLRKKITDLMADNERERSENERLDRLLISLKKTDAPPAETGKTRLTQEEMSRLRKANADLEARLSSVTEEARLQVHRSTELLKEKIKENDMVWEQARMELVKQIEHLSKPNRGGTARIEDVGGGGVVMARRTARIEDLGGGVVVAPLIPSAFLQSDGTYMVCPVPIRTGRLVSLLDIYKSSIRYPSDNEGTFFATFVCPDVKRITSLASVEEVTLLHGIAVDLRLFTIPPLRFQYYINGSWIDFPFVDQIVIAAVCCKHYRVGTSRGTENVMVLNGDFIFTMDISNNMVTFQMQKVNNRAMTISACLFEGVPDFFQRWAFPTSSDGHETDSPQ
jgi:hypothetical protein